MITVNDQYSRSHIGESAWSAAGLLSQLTGGLVLSQIQFPPLLLTLMVMMALDMLSGSAAAKANGVFTAANFSKGAWKKVAILFAAVAGFVITPIIPEFAIAGLQLRPDIGSYIAGAFTIGDFASILENVTKAGVEPHPAIQVLIVKLRGGHKKRTPKGHQ